LRRRSRPAVIASVRPASPSKNPAGSSNISAKSSNRLAKSPNGDAKSSNLATGDGQKPLKNAVFALFTLGNGQKAMFLAGKVWLV